MYWECHHPNWRTHIFQRGRLNHQPDKLESVEIHHFQWANPLFLWPFSMSQTVTNYQSCAPSTHKLVCGPPRVDPMGTILSMFKTHLYAWLCLRWFFLFSQWKIHHDWGIYSDVFFVFGEPHKANPSMKCMLSLQLKSSWTSHDWSWWAKWLPGLCSALPGLCSTTFVHPNHITGWWVSNMAGLFSISSLLGLVIFNHIWWYGWSILVGGLEPWNFMTSISYMG